MRAAWLGIDNTTPREILGFVPKPKNRMARVPASNLGVPSAWIDIS